MGLSYNGQAYAGWQSQPNGNTVQDRLEAALAQFCDQSVSTLCAGRTDAGVHGVMQVVHFDTELRRTPYSWTRGTNSFLPPDIAVQWAQEVPTGFHSRGSAVCRRYAYVLLESAIRPSLEQGRVTGCQALSPVKNIRAIRISRKSSRPESAYWRFEFEANAFLHHMIRNIMGCLIWVGQGLQPAPWMAEVLAAKDRDAAAPTFSPDGLYFLGPQYEAHWGLPPCAPAYDWLP